MGVKKALIFLACFSSAGLIAACGSESNVATDVDGNGLIDGSQASLTGGSDDNGNDVDDRYDASITLGQDANGNEIDDRFEVALTGGRDENSDGLDDEAALSITNDTDGNGLIDGAQASLTGGDDLNGNGVDDRYDAAITLRPDVNGNGVDDSYEVEYTNGNDVDNNGVDDLFEVTMTPSANSDLEDYKEYFPDRVTFTEYLVDDDNSHWLCMSDSSEDLEPVIFQLYERGGVDAELRPMEWDFNLSLEAMSFDESGVPFPGREGNVDSLVISSLPDYRWFFGLEDIWVFSTGTTWDNTWGGSNSQSDYTCNRIEGRLE